MVNKGSDISVQLQYSDQNSAETSSPITYVHDSNNCVRSVLIVIGDAVSQFLDSGVDEAFRDYDFGDVGLWEVLISIEVRCERCRFKERIKFFEESEVRINF